MNMRDEMQICKQRGEREKSNGEGQRCAGDYMETSDCNRSTQTSWRGRCITDYTGKMIIQIAQIIDAGIKATF